MSRNQKDDNFEVLKMFKEQLIAFLDELIAQFPEEGDFVFLRFFCKDKIAIEHVMHRTKYKLNICRDMIENRDDEFFLQNETLFSTVSKRKLNHFKTIWRSDRLDKEDKEVIWQWVDTFAKIADMYKVKENKNDT